MDDQEFEELAKRWPDLMQKSQQDYLGVGEGWFTLIDVLCGGLSSGISQARYQIKYAMEHPDAKFVKPIPELEAALQAKIDALPTIVQIKEKFGGLRFYVDGGTTEHHNYISFAEALSNRTCEVCGAPGEHRNDGWVKTLCDAHHKEREDLRAEHQGKPKNPGPKLSDE